MNLTKHDVNLCDITFWDIKNRLPRSVTTIELVCTPKIIQIYYLICAVLNAVLNQNVVL